MISIILPIRNEVLFINKTLLSILSQSYSGEIEILISDGMSTDGTREIVKDFQLENSFIQLIDNPEKIVSTGFNRALSVAKGNIIIRVDGHTTIDKDYLIKSVSNLINKKCDCTGGLIKSDGDSIIAKNITFATRSKFGIGNSKFHYSNEPCWTDTVYLGAYKREVFDEIGGYDEDLNRNQDDEFNFRLIQNGGNIWLDPSIKSSYVARNSLSGLFKQYFQYGFYKVRVMQKRRGFASWRHLVPGVFVLSLLVSLYLYFINNSPTPFILIGVPYVLLSIIFSIAELFKSPKYISSIILLAITYFILHFSYGIGFLSGMIYFFNKWNDTNLIDSHFNRDTFNENTLS
jgi:succinoglycan biosynthesis protein ExoA